MRALLATLLLSLTACVPDVCTRAQRLNTDFPKRHEACFADDTLPGASFDATACDTSMKPCSTADEAALQAYFDCVEKLPVCTPDTRGDFSAALLSCASGMNQLTPGCFRM
ncbi:MAG: hypothetical protein ACOZQL_32730 [Myxococcota bacterium]